MNGTYINADCMERLQTFGRNCFHLAIVDPPYGIGEDGRKSKGRTIRKDGTFRKTTDKRTGRKDIIYRKYKSKSWDNQTPGKEYFDQLIRVSKNQIIFGANYFELGCSSEKTPRRQNIKDWLLNNPKGWVAWDKVNGTNDFNDYELIKTSFDFDSFILPYMWAGMMQGKSIKEGRTQQGNKKLNERRLHPTQKPVILYRYLLQTFAESDDLILDTHTGSASSLIACEIEGFKYHAFEKDPDYYKESLKRLKNHLSQKVLF